MGELDPATNDRPPVFELHIRPMFRLLDREHMLTLFGGGVDLWELERVWEMRSDIIRRIRPDPDRNMPGQHVGGPWPQEWIDLFNRWTEHPTVDDIGHHLVLATPTAPYELHRTPPDRAELTTTLTLPSSESHAWFELESITPGVREYTLWLEPELTPSGAQTTTLVRETFVPGDAHRIVIHDAVGTHETQLA